MINQATPTILIFRIGQLGDTLIAMPVIEAIRLKYPDYRLVLLTDQHVSKTGYVSSWDVLKPTGWFNDVIFYNPGKKGWERLKMLFRLVAELRSLKVDHLFNLAPARTKGQTTRDKWFFKFLVKPRRYYAGQPYSPPGPVDGVLPRVEPEWSLLSRLVGDDVLSRHRFRLAVPEEERARANEKAQLAGLKFVGRVIAIAPGSKMSAKMWPKEYFAELGSRLLSDFPDIRLIVFGGKEDSSLGDELCRCWGERSHNLAGKLTVYGSAALLEKCTAYVGNDTGTMHLAAIGGIPCIALFSARDYPGKWEPFGNGHIVLRHAVACEGCMLEKCKYDNKCLKKITIDEAFTATKSVLKK